MLQRGWDAKKLKEEEDNKELYHICYATRDKSADFLESLSLEIIGKSNSEENENGENEEDKFDDNVDFYHMYKAFKYIDKWIKEEGKDINKSYELRGSLDIVRNSLFDLLNGTRDYNGGSVQVIWYEIAENKDKNSIKEFQKINTGKIRLTDAELIKGLFLFNKNFSADDKYIKQSELALDWEFIENTLHANNFWYFLQKKGGTCQTE